MTELALQISGLTKSFRPTFRQRVVRAVRNLSMSVERGSAVALVGPNGAGKTTTIYTLLGILKPDEGEVRIFGNSPGSSKALRLIGFQSEIFYTYPFLTARQALLFYARLSGMKEDALNVAVPEQLSRLGLSSASDRKIGTFSKGMVQRLGLAQAMLHRPELLILDEPTTGLDPAGRKLVADLIVEEKAKGTALLLSSHILSDVERTCDRIVMLDQGTVVLSEKIADLRQNTDEWELEIVGWHEGTATAIADLEHTLTKTSGDIGYVRCHSAIKPALMRRILDVPAEIGTVRRCTRSLEDLYLQHVGASASE